MNNLIEYLIWIIISIIIVGIVFICIKSVIEATKMDISEDNEYPIAKSIAKKCEIESCDNNATAYITLHEFEPYRINKMIICGKCMKEQHKYGHYITVDKYIH